MSQAEERYFPGLEGVIAGETAVSTIDNDELAYRGYRVNELADRATFEEVAYLLLRGELPNRSQLAEFRSELDAHRQLPAPLLDTIRSIPPQTGGMDVLRTGVSMLAHFDKTPGDSADSMARQATHILAAVPSMIAARLRFMNGQHVLDPKPGLSHAAQFFYLALGRSPSEIEERVLNLTLILYAEHEFNASTFAARVTTSTLADLFSAIVTGIGTLKGPLHGGANEDSIRMINQFKSAAEARAWVEQGLVTKAKISGFGHRVYKNGDERARILEPYVYRLGKERNDTARVGVYDAIRDTMWEKKQIHMNVDYPCGIVYYFLGLPIDIYTPLFVASRVSGWAAHVIEQRTNNRIIRPRSRYVGPAIRKYVPIESR